MTLAELNNILKSAGYPVAYSHFSSPPSPPYIVYLIAFSSNQFADNKVYKKIQNAQVELYTEIKDPTAESKLEAVLDQNNIPYESTETWIETEKLFQITYEIGVI